MAGREPVIRALTWNLRYDNPDDGAHSWARRRRAVAEVWAMVNPDLVFLQEVLVHQYQDVQHDQPEFSLVGQGRDGGGAGEFVPLAYRKSRFSLVASGSFWLSETPEVPGTVGWDAACPRIVTWARLVDSTGWTTVAASVHLDHVGVRARTLGTSLLLELLGPETRGASLIIAGDLNAKPGDAVHKVFVHGGFRDLVAAGEGGWPPHAETYHGFGEGPGELIDFVYGSPGCQGLRGGFLSLKPTGIFPSDHWPVWVDIDARGWVVFDMDGTLYQTETSALPACQRAFSAMGLGCPPVSSIRCRIGEPLGDFCRRLAPELSDDDLSLLTRQIEVFELEAVVTHGKLYPGVPELLATLRARGYRLAVCSLGSAEYLRTIGSATGIGSFLDLVVGASSPVTDKTTILGTMMERLGPRAVVVGDRAHDVAAAEANGLRSIGALWGYGSAESWSATVTASSPAEVCELVDELMAGYRGGA